MHDVERKCRQINERNGWIYFYFYLISRISVSLFVTVYLFILKSHLMLFKNILQSVVLLRRQMCGVIWEALTSLWICICDEIFFWKRWSYFGCVICFNDQVLGWSEHDGFGTGVGRRSLTLSNGLCLCWSRRVLVVLWPPLCDSCHGAEMKIFTCFTNRCFPMALFKKLLVSQRRYARYIDLVGTI